jgi:predicted RNA-binding Zn-ribbon protein involved in translation (DUF1610 family)
MHDPQQIRPIDVEDTTIWSWACPRCGYSEIGESKLEASDKAIMHECPRSAPR